MVDLAESVPVRVMVYVPLEGLRNVLETLLLQADMARPAAARSSTQAAARNLRAERPRKPAAKRAAKAASAGMRVGRGDGAGARLTLELSRERYGCFPGWAAPVGAQSAALASRMNCVVTGAVPPTATEPWPLLSMVVKA